MSPSTRASIRCCLVAALLLLPAPVHASDGRIEINQATVQAAGGFPFLIRNPGSYVLTGDLQLPAGSITAIRIHAHAVTLDLNGFGIRGSHVCDQSACPAGNGFGVEAGIVPPGGELATRTTLLGGEIRGFGQDCVSLGPDARVEGLVVSSCGASGVFAQERGLLLANRISFCGGFGLRLINPTSYAHNVISACDLGTGPGGSVSGGVNGGGNVCDLGRCPGERRRFYLTSAQFTGDHQTNVCVAGFHMASLFEILDPSGLEYDETLGVTQLDAGSGPPSARSGWVRTGSPFTVPPPTPGVANCQNWSSTNGDGSLALLVHLWDTSPPTPLGPWVGAIRACTIPQPAWCVED